MVTGLEQPVLLINVCIVCVGCTTHPYMDTKEDAWAIDVEGSAGFSEGDGVRGAEYYTVVIHYPGLNPTQFRPHHLKYDSEGRAVKSNYGNNQYQTQEGTRDSVFKKAVHKWSCKNDDMYSLTDKNKANCNSIKGFLNKYKCCIFYHNNNVDECATFGGAPLTLDYPIRTHA